MTEYIILPGQDGTHENKIYLNKFQSNPLLILITNLGNGIMKSCFFAITHYIACDYRRGIKGMKLYYIISCNILLLCWGTQASLNGCYLKSCYCQVLMVEQPKKACGKKTSSNPPSEK